MDNENLEKKETEIVKEERKQRGFLQDGEGDKSSGRLIKVLSFVVASITAGASLTIGTMALFGDKLDGSSFVALAIGLVTSFLAVAIGSEITQKTTGN